MGTSPDAQAAGEPSGDHLHPLGNLLPWAPTLAIGDSRSLGLSSWQVNTRLSLAFEYCPSKWPFSKSASLSFYLFIFLRLPSHNQLLELWESFQWLPCLLLLAPTLHFQFSPPIRSRETDYGIIMKPSKGIMSNRKAASPLLSSSLHPSGGISVGQFTRSAVPSQNWNGLGSPNVVKERKRKAM